MKISVIIPTYNEAKNVKKCLSAFNVQTYPNFEVIVVDDGSTDESDHFLKNYAPNYPFSFYYQSHLGAGVARNFAAKKAKGEILVFIDADMIVDKNYLKNIIRPIVARKAKGTFTKEEYVRNYQNFWAKSYNWEYTNHKTNLRVPPNHPPTSPVFRAILKSEFDRIGGYEEIGYGEDWTLSQKLGYRASAAQGAIVHHINPASAFEVFQQATWIATRPYKLGLIGRCITLIRASLPFSLMIGMVKSIRFANPLYVCFKLVYDFGIFYGQLKYLSRGQYAQ